MAADRAYLWGLGAAMTPERATNEMVGGWPLGRTGPFLLGAGAAGLLLAGAIALWVHYGTAVFFEMIRTGFAACFG